MQCTEFVNSISKTLFEEDVKRKLKRANFITVFCDGSTDSAVIEKEFIFCLLNHSIFQPTLSFIVFKDVPSQDTDGIKSTIMKAFDYIGMSELKDRMVILVSDDANINSGIKTARNQISKRWYWLAYVCLAFTSSVRIGKLVLFVPQILKEIKRIM